jgi:predicted  nucleic acid-binding Zn-ribbon protein
MSTEKLVFSQLFKMELATQKVELASIKELQKIVSDINNSFSAIEKIGNQLGTELAQAQKTKNALGDSVQSVSSLGVFANNQISDFLSKAKDLGVDVTNVKELKEIDSLQKTIKDYKNYYNGLGKIPQV